MSDQALSESTSTEVQGRGNFEQVEWMRDKED